MPKVETRKITDFSPDPSNANKGSERGLRILDNSISEVGLGRSAVADKNGLLIAGNKTQERSVDSGFEDAIVVHTTGKQLVIVQRDDFDLLDNDPNNPARRMAYYDNVASQHMAWDAAQIAADVEAGVNLDAMFTPGELEDIYAGVDVNSESPDENRYSRKIEVPLYEPSENTPLLVDMIDDTRTKQLIAEIDAVKGLSQDAIDLLKIAAQRHTVFNFAKIADFYANGDATIQRLMENSALVIVDYNRAIELGYVKLSKSIADLVSEEDE